MFIHIEGNFLEKSSRNQLTFLGANEHITNVNFDITLTRKKSTTDKKCEDRAPTYDACVEKSALQSINSSFPSTKKSAWSECSECEVQLEFLSLLRTESSQCLQACTEVRIRANVFPINLLNSLFPQSDKNQSGVYFYISSEVKLVELHESFTFVSMMASVGGYVGLLLGMSLYGSWVSICPLIPTRKLKELLDKSATVLLLILMGCTCVITVISVIRLTSKETGLEVNIHDGSPNLSISLCSLEHMYSSPENHYIGNTSNFWNKALNLRNKLKELNITFVTGETIEIFNHRNLSNTKHISYSTNIPRYKTYIENCHTLDLGRGLNEVKHIQMVAQKEFMVYIHLNGQLLAMDNRQGFAFANSLTVEEVYTGVYSLSRIVTSVTVEILSFLKVKELLQDPLRTFDNYVLEDTLKFQETAGIDNFLLVPEGQYFSAGISEETFQNLEKRFSQSLSQGCKNNVEVLTATFNHEKFDAITCDDTR